MAEIIPFNKADTKEPVCSFCKTPKSKAKNMVTSAVNGNYHICDKCIERSAKILQELK
jgi:hypothetical protein